MTKDKLKLFFKLLKLSEECNEIGQMCSKYIEFGPDNWHPDDDERVTNKTLLSQEIGDFLAVLDILEDEKIVDSKIINQQRCKKYEILYEKFRKQ